MLFFDGKSAKGELSLRLAQTFAPFFGSQLYQTPHHASPRLGPGRGRGLGLGDSVDWGIEPARRQSCGGPRQQSIK